jgi:hypothetical protein
MGQGADKNVVDEMTFRQNDQVTKSIFKLTIEHLEN